MGTLVQRSFSPWQFISSWCDLSTKTVHNLYNRSVQGFIQRRRGPGIPSPPKEILKLSMVICVLSQVLNNNLVPDYVRSNLRGSKFKNFPGGACPQTPLVHVGKQAYARYYHPATTMFFPPPTQNPVWNPGVHVVMHHLYQFQMYKVFTFKCFITAIRYVECYLCCWPRLSLPANPCPKFVNSTTRAAVSNRLIITKPSLLS